MLKAAVEGMRRRHVSWLFRQLNIVAGGIRFAGVSGGQARRQLFAAPRGHKRLMQANFRRHDRL
jgi:hypothetical protein